MNVWGDSCHHGDNDLRVDRFTTPEHIVPEWYFLPFYNMLRSSALRGLGVVLLFSGLGLYVVLLASTSFTSDSGFGCDSIGGSGLLGGLGFYGGSSPAYPYVEFGGGMTGAYIINGFSL